MTPLFTARPFLAAALALAALGAATAAHARSDLVFSIGLNAPYGYVQPAPVYVPPQPVYYQPAPVVYEPAPVYYQPAPVYSQPQQVYYRNRHRWHDHRRGPWGDADGDGVPNIHDRAPFDPYRR